MLTRKSLLTCFMGAQVPVKQYQLPLHISPPPSAPAPLSFGHVFNWCLVNLALTMFGERCVAQSWLIFCSLYLHFKNSCTELHFIICRHRLGLLPSRQRWVVPVRVRQAEVEVEAEACQSGTARELLLLLLTWRMRCARWRWQPTLCA